MGQCFLMGQAREAFAQMAQITYTSNLVPVSTKLGWVDNSSVVYRYDLIFAGIPFEPKFVISGGDTYSYNTGFGRVDEVSRHFIINNILGVCYKTAQEYHDSAFSVLLKDTMERGYNRLTWSYSVAARTFTISYVTIGTTESFKYGLHVGYGATVTFYG